MTAIINGVLSGSAYALIAVGFVMIYKGSRIFNLAHGEIGAFGLFIAWYLHNHKVPVLIAFVAGVVVATLVAIIVERTLVRRLVDRSPLAAVASTLGAGPGVAHLKCRLSGCNAGHVGFGCRPGITIRLRRWGRRDRRL